MLHAADGFAASQSVAVVLVALKRMLAVCTIHAILLWLLAVEYESRLFQGFVWLMLLQGLVEACFVCY
jgi:hypothetical protein